MIAGKAALLGVLGVGLVSTGGVAITNPSLMGVGKGRQVVPLQKEQIWVTIGGRGKGFDDSPEGSFRRAHENGRYLVGVDTHNKWWWEQQYAKISDEIKTNEKFKLATKAFDKNFRKGEKSALNAVCWDAYMTNDREITKVPTTGKYTREDIWKYCSELGGKPKSISEEEADKDKYTKANGFAHQYNREKLISTTGNDKFWEMKEEGFRTKDSRFGSELYNYKSIFFDKTKPETVRELCEQAYNMDMYDGEKTLRDDISLYINRFCSLITGSIGVR